MSKPPTLVTVTDHVPYSATVSPEAALAYVRRVLHGWRERRVPGAGIDALVFEPRDGSAGSVLVPLDAGGDWSRRMRETCEELAALGIVARPSDALRAMAGEVGA